MPSTNIPIDEAMMRCTGRSYDTYKMPSKLIEQGVKFHCLGDHGYIWDFHPVSNRFGPDPIPHIPGLTRTGNIVYHLLSKLSHTAKWIVYLDNFYTSLPLFGYCGSVKQLLRYSVDLLSHLVTHCLLVP